MYTLHTRFPVTMAKRLRSLSKRTPSSKRTSSAKTSSSRSSDVSRPTKRGLLAQSRKLNAQSRKYLVDVVVSKPSKASPVGRQAERAFIAGVNRELRNAEAHGIPVTVQGEDGRLVRGIPARRGGTYVVVDEETAQSGNLARLTNRGPGPARPPR